MGVCRFVDWTSDGAENLLFCLTFFAVHAILLYADFYQPRQYSSAGRATVS